MDRLPAEVRGGVLDDSAVGAQRLVVRHGFPLVVVCRPVGKPGPVSLV
jgi:hypothetical protein